MKTREITIYKPLADLKLMEPVLEVYVYMDFNKKTIEPFYNDERPLPLNIMKLFQKAAPNMPIQSKKFFEYFEDIKLGYDKEKMPDNLVVTFFMKDNSK